MDAARPSNGRWRSAPALSRLAALLALVLLCGSLDLHLGGEAHEGLGAASSSREYTLGASHPQLPLHVETGSPVERPRCPACLSQLQARGAHLALAHALPPPTEAPLLPAGDVRGAASGTPRGPCGRAPPLA